jgi:hypothetical protein
LIVMQVTRRNWSDGFLQVCFAGRGLRVGMMAGEDGVSFECVKGGGTCGFRPPSGLVVSGSCWPELFLGLGLFLAAPAGCQQQ